MRKKRILAVLLSSAIAFSGMPMSVFAAEDVVLEEGFSDGADTTVDVTEESTEDTGEFIPESDQEEDLASFFDGESENFASEEEIEDESDPEIQVFADDEDVVESGKCGDNLTYTITGDETNGYILTISGTGDMYDYTVDRYSYTEGWVLDVPWDTKKEKITNIYIKNGITSIGNYAFCSCEKLYDINLPESITRVGRMSLAHCESLVNISLPNKINNIGEFAFSGCSKLRNIIIPKSVNCIAKNLLRDCESLISVVLPKSITTIGDDAFCHCTNLVDITIPENVISIGEYAFYGCKITNIIIPNKVTHIKRYAFSSCTNLKKILLPESISSIEDGVFSSCENLTAIILSENVTSIQDVAFADCTNLTSIVIPNKVTSIGESSFENCSSLTSIVIPTNVTDIGRGAFENCGNLVDITLPKNITSIKAWTFKDCKSLKNIVIPEKVISIEEYAFENCNSLTNIELQKGLISIGGFVFEGCGNLTDIAIPEGVTEMGGGIFNKCTNLSCVTIPKSLLSIYNTTFVTCNLTVIKYGGTEKQWKQFGFLPEYINNATVYFDYVLNHEHLYEIRINKLATCLEAGERFSVCKLCGETYTEEIPATGHNEIILPSMEATCEEDGMTEGKKCSVCGVILERQSIIPALGHSWDDGKVSKEATCIEEGEKTYTCSRCNKNKTENISKTPHSIVIDPEEPATCTKAGKTEGSHCSVCGEIVIPQKIIQTTGEHSWNSGSLVKAALCTQNGEIQYTCTKCGLKRTETVKALGHKKVTDKSIEATCEKEGKTEGSHCSICGEVLVSQKTIPATGHSWSNWITVKNASVSSEGAQQRTCSKCGKLENRNIPKLTPTPTVAPTIPSAMTITKGKSTTLKPASSWKNVKYSTSNKKVATVDKKGKVKAVGVGTAKITVKSGSKKAVCTITVPGTTAIKGIKSTISVKRGKTYTLKPKLSYAGKADRVTYKSSNKKIATVSKKGVIKGKKKGTATITIKSGKVTKKCKVKVK